MQIIRKNRISVLFRPPNLQKAILGSRALDKKKLRTNANMKNQKKPQETKSNGIAYGISIGMLVGVALGCWLDNLALWVCIGIAVGVGVGSAIDLAKSKKNK